MAKTAELNEDLVSGLKVAKSKRAYFALVLKGSNDGALLVSKTKVPPADIAAAKKQSGGSAVLKGFCSYEEGTYVFETAKAAPATAAQAVKIIAKRDAGLAVKAEFRISSDPELLAGEEDAAAAAPSPAAAAAPAPSKATAPTEGADVTNRLNAMTADIKAALAGPNKARVQALYVAVSGQIKSKDFAQASKGLDELEQLTKQAAPPNGAELTKRLNGMTAAIKAALAGPNKARIQPLFVSASGQIKNQEFVQAAKSLDELDQLVNQAASPDDAGDDALAAEWQRRVSALEPKVLEAQKTRPNEAKWMMQFMSAQDLGGDGKYQQALDVLKKLEALLVAPPKQKSPELTAALSAWTAARANVQAQLQAEIAQVLAAKPADGSVDAKQMAAAMKEAELELKAVAKQIAGSMETKQQALEMEKWLAEDEVVADVCELAFDLKTPLLAALGPVKQHLGA